MTIGFDQLTSFEAHDGGSYDLRFLPETSIRGVNGGYIAAAALRVAGDVTSGRLPLSINCHFLRPMAPGPARASVRPVVQSTSASLVQVDISQNDRLCAVEHVWTAFPHDGPVHREARMPLVPHPDELSRLEAIMRKDEPPLPPFWTVFDQRPINRIDAARRRHRPARLLRWFRYFAPTTFETPFLDVARTLPIIDVMGIPAANQMYDEPFLKGTQVATVQLSVCFHDTVDIGAWLLSDASCPHAAAGVIATSVDIWSVTGTLVAQGVSQLIARPSIDARGASSR